MPRTPFLPPPGIRYMALAAAFFSVMTVCVKLLGSRLPSSEVVFVRSVISLGLTLLMLRRRGIPPLGRRRGLLTLRGLAGFGGLLCFFYAIPRMPLADVTVIQYTNPVFVALLAAIFLRERVGLRETVSVGLSLIGVLLIARPTFLFGDHPAVVDPVVALVALTGAIFAAIAYTIVRKLRETEDPLVVVLYFPLVSVPAAIPVMWSGMVWPTPREWLLLICVGVTTQIAQIFLTRGLHAERAARATAVSYIQIVFAALWGMAVFSEFPDLPVIAGAALVVIGTLVVGSRLRRN